MKGKRAQGTIFGLLFIILSIVVYTAEISGSMISFIMGLLACVAAPLLSVLLKVGVTNAVAHVVLGLGISFAGPIIAAWIMKKTKWMEFFLYPNKLIRKVS